ncbi:hypothetical protein BLNAU_4275 [Blattamonas nauphoetae]|uniref:Uncharacterized protein n=1 Tax=Blattamonas nauphoetae TaxID=2049346 RepID=A0ABQ9YB20_9EUKA|nr:hypothetical protein BLNAU_4275 [Blattamonas nauphoetae]
MATVECPEVLPLVIAPSFVQPQSSPHQNANTSSLTKKPKLRGFYERQRVKDYDNRPFGNDENDHPTIIRNIERNPLEDEPGMLQEIVIDFPYLENPTIPTFSHSRPLHSKPPDGDDLSSNTIPNSSESHPTNDETVVEDRAISALHPTTNRPDSREEQTPINTPPKERAPRPKNSVLAGNHKIYNSATVVNTYQLTEPMFDSPLPVQAPPEQAPRLAHPVVSYQSPYPPLALPAELSTTLIPSTSQISYQKPNNHHNDSPQTSPQFSLDKLPPTLPITTSSPSHPIFPSTLVHSPLHTPSSHVFIEPGVPAPPPPGQLGVRAPIISASLRGYPNNDFSLVTPPPPPLKLNKPHTVFGLPSRVKSSPSIIPAPFSPPVVDTRNNGRTDKPILPLAINLASLDSAKTPQSPHSYPPSKTSITQPTILRTNIASHTSLSPLPNVTIQPRRHSRTGTDPASPLFLNSPHSPLPSSILYSHIHVPTAASARSTDSVPNNPDPKTRRVSFSFLSQFPEKTNVPQQSPTPPQSVASSLLQSAHSVNRTIQNLQSPLSPPRTSPISSDALVENAQAPDLTKIVFGREVFAVSNIDPADSGPSDDYFGAGRKKEDRMRREEAERMFMHDIESYQRALARHLRKEAERARIRAYRMERESLERKAMRREEIRQRRRMNEESEGRKMRREDHFARLVDAAIKRKQEEERRRQAEERRRQEERRQDEERRRRQAEARLRFENEQRTVKEETPQQREVPQVDETRRQEMVTLARAVFPQKRRVRLKDDDFPGLE